MPADSVTRDELAAYVDRLLPAARRPAVEARLASDPEAAALVATWRTQNELMHRLYDPVLDEPIPERLRPPAPAPAVGARRLAQLAAALALLLLGGAAGWGLRDLAAERSGAAGQSLAAVAARAHAVFTPEVRHPVEVGADAEAHLVKWLSKRLDAELKAPVLQPAGFALVGGRLLADSGGPAALFMYEDRQGSRLTLYVSRRDRRARETAFRYALQEGIGVFYWIDSELSYALAGQLDRERLLHLSRTVYDQLER